MRNYNANEVMSYITTKSNAKGEVEVFDIRGTHSRWIKTRNGDLVPDEDSLTHTLQVTNAAVYTGKNAAQRYERAAFNIGGKIKKGAGIEGTDINIPGVNRVLFLEEDLEKNTVCLCVDQDWIS